MEWKWINGKMMKRELMDVELWWITPLDRMKSPR